jgi:hypothetical protein
MKKLAALFGYAVACLIICSSCHHGDHDISIRVSDSEHFYMMDADFSKGKTRDVDEYMDRKIGNKSNMSFVNTRIDGTLALDDHTTFYIKKRPGYIAIKLDKNRNSDEAYLQIKSMCDGIKKVLTR